MKGNFLQKNRLRQPHTRRILILLGIFLAGSILFNIFDSIVVSVVSPIWRAENSVSRSLRNIADFIGSQEKLIKENADLREKVSSLEIEVMSLSREQALEDTLRELAGRKPDPETKIATVLTHPPQTPYDIIIIDAGSSDGVLVGKEVYLPEGPSLGAISEVFSNRSRVKLFTSSGEETNAVLERNNVPVVLHGLGAGNFRLTLPRDTAVEPGDKILSPELSSRLMAVVGEVIIQPTDSFKEVLAKSPANIFILRYVFVTP